jgi:hypothetical protein
MNEEWKEMPDVSFPSEKRRRGLVLLQHQRQQQRMQQSRKQ